MKRAHRHRDGGRAVVPPWFSSRPSAAEFGPPIELREDSDAVIAGLRGRLVGGEAVLVPCYSVRDPARRWFRGGSGAGLPASGPFSGHHSGAATRPRHRLSIFGFLHQMIAGFSLTAQKPFVSIGFESSTAHHRPQHLIPAAGAERRRDGASACRNGGGRE